MTGYHYEKDRILVLSHEIDDKTVHYYIKKILRFNAEDRVHEEDDPKYSSPIHLVLNSFGGGVYDGLALISTIETSKTEIHITCLGAGFSMGLFILASGHIRFAHELTTFMYHELSDELVGTLSKIKGDSAEMTRVQTVLDQILISKSNFSKKFLNLKTKGKEDWYFTAAIAHKYKLIDHII